MSLNKQEAFDKAARGIILQGGPSREDGSACCLYRGPDGRRCAIGHLIPDELYDPDMEGRGITTPVVISPIRNFLTSQGWDSEEDVYFLMGLQEIHDNASMSRDFINDFIEYAAMFAAKYNLNTSVLSTARANR
jgi:hypothetical protein